MIFTICLFGMLWINFLIISGQILLHSLYHALIKIVLSVLSFTATFFFFLMIPRVLWWDLNPDFVGISPVHKFPRVAKRNEYELAASPRRARL